MKFINKLNKLSILQEVIYWILSWTWGIIMTLIGAFPAIALLITGHKPQVFGWDICFVVGKNWGGVSFGVFIFVDSVDDFHNKCHEHGHGLQNILMGPLFPFIVGIRSTIRYWMRERADYDDKTIFCAIVTSVMELVSSVGIALGYIFNNLAVTIVATLALAYTIYLGTVMVTF